MTEPTNPRTEAARIVDEREAYSFVASSLDDAGLDVYSFRIYAHALRRAGFGTGGTLFASVRAMAARCKMSERRAREALRDLEARCMLVPETRPGETTVYRLTSSRAWRTPAGGAALPRHVVPPTPARGAAKGTPPKELPLKEDPKTSSANADASEAPEVERSEGRVRAAESTARPLPVSARPHTAETPSRPSQALAAAKTLPARGSIAETEALFALVETWNAHRGDLPAAKTLSGSRRSGLRRLLAEHGARSAAILTAATLEVAADPFWNERGYGLDNLLAGDKFNQKAETAHARGGVDRERAAEDRILAAIGGAR